jgi:hypothetical protein
MKTVLITGASGGIGQACARVFAQNGYLPILHYHKNEAALGLAEELGGFAVRADIACSKEVQAMFAEIFGRIQKLDVLINNAGGAHRQMLCDTTPAQWQGVLDVNLTGAYHCIKCALEHMMWAGGRIINISSVWGQCGGSCEAAYSAAKAGLVGLTKALAKEYPNIGVNCICPGVIDTPMNDGFSVEERQALLEQIPAGRFGRPEEVAAAALFLASDGAAYITGQVLAVNGGLYM